LTTAVKNGLAERSLLGYWTVFSLQKGKCHASKAGGADSGSFFLNGAAFAQEAPHIVSFFSPVSRNNDPAGERGVFDGNGGDQDRKCE
jgi:hypothetical protein